MPFPALGIKARLNVVLLSVFAVALVLDFALLVPAVFGTVRKAAEERQLSLVSGVSDNIEAHFQRARQEAEALALLPGLRSLDKEKMDQTILVANAANAFFDYFFVTDALGRWISYPTQPQLLGKSILPENMAWVRATIGGNASYVLDAHRSQLDTIVTGVASPIRGADGRAIGLVRGVITLDEEDSLFSLVKGVGTGPDSLCALLDREGRPITSSQGSAALRAAGSADLPPLARMREASGGCGGSFVVEEGGREWLATIADIQSAGWTVAIGQALDEVMADAWRLAVRSAALFLTAILVSLLAIRFPIGRSLASLGVLLSAMRGGEAPDSGAIRGGDEIAGLAREIGRLYADLAESKRSALESEARIARLKRFEDLGILAAGIAHNYRNILQGIGASAELMGLELRECPPSSVQRLSDIRDMVSQGSELATALMRLGKGQASGRTVLDLKALVFDLAGMFGHAHPGISLQLEAEDKAFPVEADRGSLQQVFLNLFMNAVQAMEEKGRLGVRVEPCGPPEGQEGSGGAWVCARVSDEGPGMDEETQTHLFEPFFSRKEGGTGLGLSSAFRIVQDHGGLLSCSSEPGRGATFTVRLPLSPGKSGS